MKRESAPARFFAEDAVGTVCRQALALLAGLAGQRAGSLVVAVLLCRLLSPDAFGRYIFVLSLIEIAVLCVGLGSQTIVVRNVSQGTDVEETYGAAVGLRLALAAGVYPLLLAAAWRLQREQILQLSVFMGIGMAANALAEVPLGILLGQRRMGAKAGLDAATSAAGVGMVWFALAAGWGLAGAAAAYALRGVIAAAAAFAVCGRLSRLRPRRATGAAVRALARQSLPLFADALAVALYTRVTPILLLLWVSDAAAGLYGGAFRIFEMVTLAGTVFARAAFPAVSGLCGVKRLPPARLVRRLMWTAVLGAVASMAVVAPAAGWWLRLLLGRAFLPAAPILGILLAAVPLIYVYEMAVHVLYATHRQRAVMCIGLTGIVVSLTLNTVLVPAGGLIGAAAALFVNEGLLFGLYLRASRVPGLQRVRRTAVLLSMGALALARGCGPVPGWAVAGAVALLALVRAVYGVWGATSDEARAA